MIIPRIIPILNLLQEDLVKTVRFKHPSYVGDPINTLKILNEKQVDEICLIDIRASKQNQAPNFTLLEKIAGECFMPLSYGGAIRTVEDARQIFQLGFEKIILQNSAFNNPDLITSLVDIFGSQSVCFSLDVRPSLTRRYKVFSRPSLYFASIVEVALRYQSLGVGEIILTAVDKEGTFTGPDLNLIRTISPSLNIPLVYNGGVRSMQDIKTCIDNGADAVAAGSFFVHTRSTKSVLISYPDRDNVNKTFSLE